MKQLVIAQIGLTLLLGTVAWSAPQKAPAPVTAPDEINVSTDDGGHGGGYGGGSQSWTLRSNDTATHSQTFSAADTVGGGAQDYTEVGIMQRGSFDRMLMYLQWTRLLDMKLPKPDPNAEVSGYTVTLVRSGKTKSLRLAGDTLAINAAASTTSALIAGLTKDVVWKTDAQFKAATGMAVSYYFDATMDKTDAEAAKDFPRPLYSVRDAAGKEVAVLRPQTDTERAAFLSPPPIYSAPADYTEDKNVSSFFTIAPGTYRLAFKNLESPAPANMKDFAWNALEYYESGGDFVVKPGEFCVVSIRLEKKSAPK